MTNGSSQELGKSDLSLTEMMDTQKSQSSMSGKKSTLTKIPITEELLNIGHVTVIKKGVPKDIPIAHLLVGDELHSPYPLKEETPDGLGQHEAGAKLDRGKPDASLLLMFGKALEEVARVGTFGAEKYTRGGWQHVAKGYTRYAAALLRHLFKSNYEDYDPDSGLLHIAHAAWNALAILELRLRRAEDE